MKEINQTKFLGILSDGSTDSSIKEQEMFFLHYVIAGQVKVRFLQVKEVEKANAQGILSAMQECVNHDGMGGFYICLSYYGL